ncbi:MAG: hypothetical protein MUO50_19360, partial [Longimicrobiales bacterium]|nr:hypothetical protein [Longimicrobiales bacterium]
MRVSDSRSIAMILLCLAAVLCPSQAGAQNDRNRERKTRFSFLMLGAWAGPGSADDLKQVLIQAGFGDTPAWPGYGKDYPRSFGGSGGLEFEIGYEHPSAWGLAVSAGRADFGVVQGFRATSETGEEGEYLAFRHSLRHLSPVVTYRLGPLRTSLGPTFVHARAKVEAPGLGQEKQETLKVGMEASVGASSALLIPWLQVAVQARYRLVGSPEFGPFEAHDGAVPSFKVGFNHWQVGVGLGLRFEGSGVAGGPSTSDLPPT